MEALRSDSQFNQQEEQTLSMSDLMKNIRSKWYWYLISFVAVFALAGLYLLSATQTYTRTVQILLKSDSSQFMTTDLESLGVKPINSDLIDEMFILSSPEVMQTVVERLGINNVYTTRKGLRRVDLYQKSPIEVELADSLRHINKYSLSMKVKIGPDSTFTLSSLRLPKDMGGKISGEFKGRFGRTVSTPAGPIAVYATRNLDPEWVGRTVKFSYTNPTRCARTYLEKLKADYDEEAGSVITMSITSPSEQKADDVLRGIVQAYNERWINDRNKIALSTSQFIEERLGNIENELSAVEGNITDYQSRHAIVDMEAVSAMYLQQSAENRKALDDIAQEIATAKYVKKELEADDITKLLPATADIAGTPIQEMVKSYNELVVDRNLRLQSMDPESPLLAKKTVAITEMRSAILESIDQTLAILNARLGALKLIDSGNRSRLSNAPSQNRYLMSEDRKQKVMESLYVYLLQRREENQLSQAFTAYNTRMVTEPYGTPGPTAPNTRNVLLIAFVLALLIPTLIIYIREITNTKVRGREDLAGLSVPYVGEIPHVARAVHRKRENVPHTVAREVMVRPRSGDLVDEAFRMVRTNIEFMGRRDDSAIGQVLMVVSLVPGSGKTFISLNLAATFAIKSKKVCLVDMDLRKGTLSQTVGSPRTGLTDVLVGDASIDNVVVHDVNGIAGFDILPEGTVPPNPTELLFSPRVKELIDELKRRYDYVILDCPPVEAVADSKVINKFVNMTVFVVRAGLLDRANLGLIQEYYDGNRFNNMAMVLNDTQEIHGVYGRYGYGNSYGYYIKHR